MGAGFPARRPRRAELFSSASPCFPTRRVRLRRLTNAEPDRLPYIESQLNFQMQEENYRLLGRLVL